MRASLDKTINQMPDGLDRVRGTDRQGINALQCSSLDIRATALSMAKQGAQPARRLLAVEPGSGNVEDQRLPVFVVLCGLDTVKPQEDDRGGHRRALVAVDERVVPAEIEEIRGGDLSQVGKRRLAAEGRLRRGDGRFQQTAVAQSGTAAERVQYSVVNLQNCVHA